jgi:isochorismate synthase
MVEQQTRTPIVEKLAERLEDAVARAEQLGRPVLLSVSQQIDPVEPLRLFANSAHYVSERWYWEHPEEQLTIVGAGVATTSIAPWQSRFSEIKRLHQEIADDAITDSLGDSEHPGIRFFAAFSFDPERKPDRRIWKGFATNFLYVPRAMLIRQGNLHTLTFNLLVSGRREAETTLRSLDALHDRTWKSLQKEVQKTKPRVNTIPTEDDAGICEAYRETVRRTSEAIREGAFEKAVLARYRDIRTDNYFDVHQAIEKLTADYPGCYTFAIARHGSIFVGASPERLVKQEKKQVSAACLAGSIRRGDSTSSDSALGQQLMESAKDQHEHEVCARAIREALEPLCAEFDAPDTPQLLSFSNVHHLYTPITGTLSNGSTLIDLVERLHPTPAVGGYPKDVAQQFLREHEGFDRGWYASPIGWMDENGDGEFIVALRSAIISGQRARLFAGCGIVGESDPEQELAESEVKLRPMLAALEGDES